MTPFMGRPIKTTLPDASVTHTAYHPTGQVKATWGSQTYPTWNIYDEQGRMTQLHTWKSAPTLDPTSVHDPATISPPAGSEVTTWIYGSITGHLVEKNYSGETDTGTTDADYTYTPAGRLLTCTWERGTTTTYGYTHGLLTSIDYSDATPDVAIAYDAFGRTTQVSNGLAKSTYLFDPATLVLDTETITYDLNTDGTPDLLRVLDRKQDSLLRDTGFDLKNGSTVENQAIYGYDSAGRLSTVTDAANTFTYGYQYNQTTAADPRIGSTTGTKQDFMPYTLTKSGSPVLQTIRTYDARRDALATIQNNAGTIPRSSYTYTVNPLGQRTDLTTAFDLGVGLSANPGDTAWGYDGLGQLESAAAPGTAADRYFAYDAIGNRLESRSETASNSGGTLTEYFGKLTPFPEPGANRLNQYVGIAKGGITLQPLFDLDGNMTHGPLPAAPTENSTLTWDAENRMTSSTVSGTTTGYLYDAYSRRIAKGTAGGTTLYLYDDWNCIAEYSASALPVSTSVLRKTRLWGMDLSGSRQGAGSVGGLLSESSLITSTPITFNSFFPTYDGNGNVSEYLASNGSVAAHFEYDPFGNTVVNTDTTGQFSYRFSTKPKDLETGLYYYGYRYYDPMTGRWPSRDPINEDGGCNLYGSVHNNAVNVIDYLGLKDECKGEVVAGHGGKNPNGYGNDHNGDDFNKKMDDYFNGGKPRTTCYVGCASNYFNNAARVAGFGVANPPINNSRPFLDSARRSANDPAQSGSFRKDAQNFVDAREKRAKEGGTPVDDFLPTDDNDQIPADKIDEAIQAMVSEKCQDCKCKSIEITIKQGSIEKGSRNSPDRTETRECPKK